jgi:MFS family permease
MILSLFRNRSFLFLWLAQIAATLGNELYNIGVIVAIYERTGSAVQATGVLVARTLPPFLLSPVAGALVDRYDRRWVLVGMNLLRVGLIALFLFTAGELPSVWLIYAIVCGIALADIFYKPAQMALIPSVVARPDLMRANSLIMSTNLAGYALAYGAGGWLLLQFGVQTLLVVDLSSFVFGAFCAWQITPHAQAAMLGRADASMPLRQMITDGLRYVRRHDLARALVTMEALEHIPHGIWTASIMLVFAERALQATSAAWGYQNAVFWGGTVVGSVVALLLANRITQRPGWTIIANAFLNSGITFSYALSPNLAVALLICSFYGLPSAFRDVAQDTLLQSSVDQRMLGRVYATRHMLVNLCFLCASLALAWLADQTSVRGVYLLGSLLYGCTALFALSQRALRQAQLGEPTTQAGVANG